MDKSSVILPGFGSTETKLTPPCLDLALGTLYIAKPEFFQQLVPTLSQIKATILGPMSRHC